MVTIREDAGPYREGLALPRFLAVFLFAGALCFAMGTVGAMAWAASGNWRGVAGSVVGGLTAWMLGWLGMVLWTGRRIPRWFMAGFGLVLVGVPVLGVMFDGTWMEILLVIGTVTPTALALWNVVRDYPATGAKPAPIEEL